MNLIYNKFALSLLLASSLGFAADIDLRESTVSWVGSKVTESHTGKILLKSATMNVTNDIIVAGKFEVDLKTISVEDIKDEKYNKKFIGHINSKDFFEVEKFPTATFVVQSGTKGLAKGQLTIKGKTQPAEMSYHKEGSTFKGKITFDRTKFGIVYNSGNFFKDLGDKLINDEVIVAVKLVQKK